MSEREERFQLTGTIIDAKYRVERLVGVGGFGVVYRAMHVVFQKPVALKCLTGLEQLPASERERLLSQFVSEGALLAELSSQTANIVQARDIGAVTTPTGEWLPYLVLEWLDGKTLDDWLTDVHGYPCAPCRSVSETYALMTGVAKAFALAHTHAAGVAHRDLKPANLMVVGELVPGVMIKILDFGIAKVMQSHSTTSAMQTTQGGLIAFTPQYAAPEQWSRDPYGATGPWTDVYQMALILVEIMLGGRPALKGESPPQLLYATTHPHLRPTPRHHGVEVSDEVERVFQRALATHVVDRYATMAEFWEELGAAIEEVPFRGAPADPRRSRALPGSASRPSASHPSASHPSASHPSASHPSASHLSASHPSRSHPSASHPALSHSSLARPPLSRPPSEVSATPVPAGAPVAAGPSRSKTVLAISRRPALLLGLVLGLLGSVGAGISLFFFLVANSASAPAAPEPEAPAASRLRASEAVVTARRTLGRAATRQVLVELEGIIDAKGQEPAVIAAARLIQAELMLLNGLSAQMAVMLDPSEQKLLSELDHDLIDVEALFDVAKSSTDAAQLSRVQVLQALVQGKLDSPALVSVSAELRPLVLGAPLWRDPKAKVPRGLIPALESLPDPTALHQSLLALALWRSGDAEGARRVVSAILRRVDDMPAARALLVAFARGTPAPAAGSPAPAPKPPEAQPEKLKARPLVEPPDPGIKAGCQKVKDGAVEEGISLLLQAVDRRGTWRHVDLCVCLGEGFGAVNNHHSAFTWFKRAIEIAPKKREALAGAGAAAEKVGKRYEAITYYRSLLALDPEDPIARKFLDQYAPQVRPQAH